MATDNLKGKAAKGVFWTSIQRFSSIGIQFVSGIILARLLTPEDYGCIGMLSIFMLIAASFVDGGFGSALIQKKNPTQIDYSTIFFWNLGVALIMYVILFLCAPAISCFFKIDLLCSVLRVQGLVLIINAFSVVQINQLTKAFKFKKIAIVTVLTAMFSLLLTIWLAYKGFGVWALVSQGLFSALFPAIIYWLTNRWLPLFAFSKDSFKQLFNFGFFMFLCSIYTILCNNIQGILIGRLYNPAAVGYYSKAHSTEILASNSISQVISQVSFPLYAELQNNKEKMAVAIKRMTLLLAFITFPLMLLLILLAKPIFLMLYSTRWLDSVPYFQILCCAGLAICLQSVNAQPIAAIGKSKVMLRWTIFKQTMGLVFVVVGLMLFGMKGLLGGMVVKSWLIYIVNASLVSKYIGYKLVDQMMDLMPTLLLAVISFFVSYTVGMVFNFNMYVKAISEFIIFFIIYFGNSCLFRFKGLEYFKQTIPLIVTKFKMNNANNRSR